MTKTIILPPKNEFYNKLVKEMIRLIKSGRMIWTEPWIDGIPRNFRTKKKYQGINILSLLFHAYEHGFKSFYWLTENQAISLGGRIKKEERNKGGYIYKVKTEQVIRVDENDKTKTVIIWYLIKEYKVYNIEQITDLRIGNVTEPPTLFFDESTIHNILNKYKNQPEIVSSNIAAYIPRKDIILMPDKERFISFEEYYCTLFHELIHSTGHPSRLNRIDLCCNYDTDLARNYAKEELIAELGAFFMCALCGFHYITRRNSVGYLSYWLDYLRKDRSYLLRAVNAAQRAVELIMGELDINRETEQTTQHSYPGYEAQRNLMRA